MNIIVRGAHSKPRFAVFLLVPIKALFWLKALDRLRTILLSPVTTSSIS